MTTFRAIRHAAANAGWLIAAGVIIIAAYVAYETSWFTKPLSWTMERQALGYVQTSTPN